MKSFVTSGTGNQQTLSEIESDKMPIYDSITDVTADLANLADGQIVATKDTGTELSQPVDAVEEGNLHAVTSNAVAESLSYSTTEQKTGGVWIDGKPIYRKVIDCGAMPNATSKGVLHNIQNFGYLIDSKILAKTAEGIRVVCNYGGTSLSLYVDNVNVIISSAYDFSSYSGYAVLEYTKTTE